MKNDEINNVLSKLEEIDSRKEKKQINQHQHDIQSRQVVEQLVKKVTKKRILKSHVNDTEQKEIGCNCPGFCLRHVKLFGR